MKLMYFYFALLGFVFLFSYQNIDLQNSIRYSTHKNMHYYLIEKRIYKALGYVDKDNKIGYSSLFLNMMFFRLGVKVWRAVD